MIADAKVGVRGKLDLMSNIYTIMDNILLVESAREIHRGIFENFILSWIYYFLQLFFYFIFFFIWDIIILGYYYFQIHLGMRTVMAIPIGYRGNEPRVALSLEYFLLKVSSGCEKLINT